MFRDQVMEHYRVRGYTLHEGAKVRGRSGTVYRCDLVAEGPLGSLVVSFGDAGGFEGPELSAVKRTAHDIGAAPVVAAPHLPDPVLRAAREMGVIVLDNETVGAGEAPTTPASEPDHPWPDPDQPTSRRRPVEATPRPAAAVATPDGQSLWRHPRAGPPVEEEEPERTERSATTSGPERASSSSRFAWLPGSEQEAPAPTPRAPREAPSLRRDPLRPSSEPSMGLPRVEDRPRRRVLEVEAPAAAGFPWQRIWGPVLYGIVTALVLFLFVVLFL